MLTTTIYEHVKNHGDKPLCHFVEGDQTRVITWRDLAGSAAQFSYALRESSISNRNVVLIFLPHVPELLSSFVGAMFAGCIPSFMPCPSSKQDRATYWKSHATLVGRIGPAAIITNREHAEEMKRAGLFDAGQVVLCIEDLSTAAGELCVPSNPSSVALLQHSSGTTGLKKGVSLSHDAIERQIRRYAEAVDLSPGSAIVSWLPLYHDMGLIACFLLPILRAVPFTMLDPFRWVLAPHTLFEQIENATGTHVWLPNFAFEHLVRTVDPSVRHYDLSSVRAFVNCSEFCRADTFQRFADRFYSYGVRIDKLQVCYAMAESVFAVTQTQCALPCPTIEVDTELLATEGRVELKRGGERLLSTGKPLTGMQVQIVDQNREPLADGVVGEIAISGDFLFSGYHSLPEKSAERLRDGWYYTHDSGFIWRAELYVLGRLDDLIIVNGRNYYAHELEHVISQIPGVKPGRVVTFGYMNDALGTQEAVALAERKQAMTPEEESRLKREIKQTILDQVGLTLSAVKLLAVGELVKTTSGKISRDRNRADYLKRIGRLSTPGQLKCETAESEICPKIYGK